MKAYIITSAKFEECYIEEWVKYHLNIGFDKIIINDNNPKDYQYQLKDILKKYIDDGQVIIEKYWDEHQYNEYENIDNIMPDIYLWLYKKYENEFDWVAKLDIDEYLVIKETENNIKTFLQQDKFNNVLSIVIPWNVYTVKNEYKKNYTRLENNRDRYIKLEGQTHNMWSFKSIIRKTDLINHIGLHFANFEDSEYINYCLSDGNNASEKLLICCDNINDDEQFKRAEECNDYIENDLINQSCCINHYGDCCIEEEVNRCIKFNGDTNNNWCRHDFYLELKSKYPNMFEHPRDLYKIYFLYNKDWKAYVTYCNDEQKNEFNIKETEHIKLINIFEDMELPNINHINHHYSQIISMYYVWKNNLYSDYVCIWDHRRFFTPINFDRLDNNEIQAYFHVYTEMTPYEYMIHEGMNEYIIYQFIKYMIEKRNVDHDKIINLIYKRPWEDRLWLITGFNCNWNVFTDICNFTFDFVNYIIPNGNYESYESIEQFVQDMKLSMSILRSKCKEGEIIEYGRIESEDRDIGNITECLYPLFCELMGYQSFTEWEDKHIVTKIFDFDDNTIYDKVFKWVHKNQFTGCRDFTLVTSQDNKQRLIDLLKDGWYQILHCPIQIITEDELKENINYTFIELNQYIDNNSPTDKLNLDNIKNI